MEPSSLREDILEALCKVQASGGARLSPGEVASVLGRDTVSVSEAARVLEEEGALTSMQDGTLVLTQAGSEQGGRVMRKHRILECFFSGMLGMPQKTASDEACTLEHEVSDETIDRLGRYLQSPGNCRGRRGWPGACIARGFPLSEASEGAECAVSCVRCGGPDLRLGDLGILPGERIRLVRRIPGNGVVVRVKGSDIALSHEIASSILVERIA